MKALKLVRLHNCPIPHKIGKEIGFGGAHGEVFEIKNNSDQVIKFCVLYESNNNLEKIYKTIAHTLNYLIKNPSSLWATVYSHNYLGKYFRSVWNNERQEYILYDYIMEKLNKITEDERKVFHTILSHEDANKIKNYSQNELKKILNGLKCGLEFDENKIINFCAQLQKSILQHNDLHPRNIMKDKCNNFKLIDFDRCTINSSY